MAKKNKNPGIVLATAMTKAQLDHVLDLRQGSRSSRHLTAQQRAGRRNSKAGQSWRREVW